MEERASQASLLEAMEERQVTVDGKTYPLPELFMVIATQNPVEQLGTYPLPETQLDRFMMKVSMGYPEKAKEKTDIVTRALGGGIAYLLFYFAVLLPCLALFYSLYGYFRFKIVQNVERVVVKAQKVPYRLLLANEDWIPFTNIALNYYSDMVTVKEEAVLEGKAERQQGNTRNLCLLSKEKLRVNTEMYCKYRGTYPVGVKSVSVTDFLGLFTITYPMKDQIRLTAKPRIIPLEQLEKTVQKNRGLHKVSGKAVFRRLRTFEKAFLLHPLKPDRNKNLYFFY